MCLTPAEGCRLSEAGATAQVVPTDRDTILCRYHSTVARKGKACGATESGSGGQHGDLSGNAAGCSRDRGQQLCSAHFAGSPQTSISTAPVLPPLLLTTSKRNLLAWKSVSNR